MNGGARTMRIGELAEHLGVSPRALRHYEHQGLLAPSREHNGYRVYDEVAIGRAGVVKDLLAVGLTAQDVRGYLEEGCLDRPSGPVQHCAAELETARSRLAALDELIGRLQRTRRALVEHHDELDRSVGPG